MRFNKAYTGRHAMQEALATFNELDLGEITLVEYVWIGGSGSDLRCKTRTMPHRITSLDQLPVWNFDGSSTCQAPGHDSEVLIRPCRIFRDPFRGGHHIMVICDCLKPDMTPINGNTRVHCADVMHRASHEIPWFGCEQEYTLFEQDGMTPIGWPSGGYPPAQGPYYCGAGAGATYGREISDAHARASLYAGINISGTNGEVMPGQWEFQVGPSVGIDEGDELWMARYIMYRVCEVFNVHVSFDPKPIPGDWNGAGCHCNYSTDTMRKPGGYAAVLAAIEKLSTKQAEHIIVGDGCYPNLTLDLMVR